jgi:hypothetical protein
MGYKLCKVMQMLEYYFAVHGIDVDQISLRISPIRLTQVRP